MVETFGPKAFFEQLFGFALRTAAIFGRMRAQQ
jgi:hypothetical protein